MYDLDYFKHPNRAKWYSSEQINHIIRPYSRIQTTQFDFNLNDEFAVFQEPLDITYDLKQTGDFKNIAADRFLEMLNKEEDAQSFFNQDVSKVTIPVIMSSKPRKSTDPPSPTVQRNMKIVDIEEDLNNQILQTNSMQEGRPVYDMPVQLNQTIGMPSGCVF